MPDRKGGGFETRPYHLAQMPGLLSQNRKLKTENGRN
jgi:hypothetical protein